MLTERSPKRREERVALAENEIRPLLGNSDKAQVLVEKDTQKKKRGKKSEGEQEEPVPFSKSNLVVNGAPRQETGHRYQRRRKHGEGGRKGKRRFQLPLSQWRSEKIQIGELTARLVGRLFDKIRREKKLVAEKVRIEVRR